MSADEVTSPAPPGMSRERWERLTRAARSMDIWRQEGSNGGSISGRIRSENRVLPAPLAMARELADTSVEGPDMPNDSQQSAHRAERGQ